MDITAITRQTQLCISLAARPSSIGTRFHNFLYDALGLDFVYKACTTSDIDAAIGGVRALGIRGCGVSMPFKGDVIALVDSLDDSAAAIEAVNTIVNTDGQLRAYNTDYLAIASLLRSRRIPATTRFAVLGSGGMARAVLAALSAAGLREGVVVARNESTGRALADRYDIGWRSEMGSHRPQLLVNATPIGMADGPDADRLPVSAGVVAGADTIFDVVAFPTETPMVQLARTYGKRIIHGAEVLALQAAEQFVLYTGVRPTDEQLRMATAFSRAG